MSHRALRNEGEATRPTPGAESLSRMGALPHSMARHGRGRGGRRRPFNLRRVRVAALLAIGALATRDVATGNITNAAVDPYRLMSVDLQYKIGDVKAVADDNFEIGLAHSDYTAAEVEECLEAQAAIDLGDKIAQEQSNRLVRYIGTLTGQTVVNAGYQFNDGKPVHTKLNWKMSTGDILNVWIRNGSDTVWTDGANIGVMGNMWIKD